MTAASAYAAMVDACAEQRARLGLRDRGARWDRRAAMFRVDPKRDLDPNLAALASYVEPADSVLDVGGGAGRIGLPLALRCREVINVEPSAGMREQFAASAAEAGVTNARAVAGEWPAAAPGVEGDVAVVANVTYFVREIVPFLQALHDRSSRRVVVSVWSVPPPNQFSVPWALINGEPQHPVPGHRELLAVLWEMGLLPDVRVLGGRFDTMRHRAQTREEAIAQLLEVADAEERPGAAALAEAHLGELFSQRPDGFEPAYLPAAREILITWPT